MSSAEYTNKRKSIEEEHEEHFLTKSLTPFQISNPLSFRRLLKAGLWITGLQSRGKRNALDLSVKEIDFRFDNLPEKFDGFTILQISDLHLDGLPGLAENVCEKIDGIEADLCVLTGDYSYEVHWPNDKIYSQIREIISNVKSKHGTVGILGNHDFAESVSHLRNIGIKMLVNDSMKLSRGEDTIWIVGLDDPNQYECDDIPGAMYDIPGDAFKILLVHSPDVIKKAHLNGVNLYLCGHTHGGQIRLPLIGPVINNSKCPRKYLNGTWQYENVKGYTSAGVGTSLVPARFHCPPEIGLIRLGKSKVNHTRVDNVHVVRPN